ncbi:MAG: glycosyltransferase [Proteobacteria bacterium]|nr:glycosyltransferase [Pseudomonadota bacterium]
MRVLYLCYDGLLEPLIQSQVLAYLERLSRHHEITLVTFEKPADLGRPEEIAALRRRCAGSGIRWVARRYHHRPRLLATLYDLAVFLVTAMRECRRGRAELIHARGYIAVFVALATGWLLRRPYIFDMRSFWPDEMVSAGRMAMGSPLYRVLKRAERFCLKRARAVVVLTEAAVAHLSALPELGPDRVSYTVIPTCADTGRFRPRPDRASPVQPRLFATLGTVIGGWFLMDWLFAFWSASLAAFPELRFRIVSRDDAGAIRAAGAAYPAVLERLEIGGLPPAGMPAAVAEFDVGAMFFTADFSKLGSCPTRMGEMLACGCPVVANGAVGDVGEIIRRYRVGVVAEDSSAASMRRTVGELANLLQDADLARRCRAAAEDWFSLERGSARYDSLYRRIAGERMNDCGANPDRDKSGGNVLSEHR